MSQDVMAIRDYLEANKKLIQGQRPGIQSDFWIGYYQGKLDMIDFTRRFLDRYEGNEEATNI